MSMCLPPHGKEGICYGCGKPVRDEKVDPEWYKKPHIIVEFSLKENSHDNGIYRYLHNNHYNLAVHDIECLKKVDWNQVKADILWAEKTLMKREDDDIGV